ncbi:MAG TPA: hypothetical protein VLD19_01975 [Chitinophagaceae bacterium]|nr:hypothetical protein [Chitinophagaceae bacterium]
MRSTFFLTVLLAGLLFQCAPLSAQTDSSRKEHKVLVFTPLYLDSAFDKATGEYRYGKQFPHFITPGLEFYEGTQLALDSLSEEKLPLTVEIYDTHSASRTIEQALNSPEAADAGLIIGYVTQAEERILAAHALKRNIPFINVNMPTDAGISNNPSLVILNSTLKTHCEGLYHFLQRYYPITPVVVFRKKGSLEDKLKTYLTDFEKATNGGKINMKYITLDENNPGDLRQYLDSDRLNIALVGSLDESFSRLITQQLSTLSVSYKSLVIGMPTWDGIDFTRKEFKGLDIVYSTPFYTDKADVLSNYITDNFNSTMFSKPSDMVFRGFECMYRFGKLLVEKDSNLVSSIGEKKFKVFTDFDIQPVLNHQTLSLEYFENKKLYFIKKTDGVIKQVY